jgi:hypothetical protein
MKNKPETLIFFLMSLPIIYFYWFVYSHVINVPYQDDFQILNTIVRVQNEPQKWGSILIENFNGHRFGEIKLLFWFDYWLEGQINFSHLCIFGSLFLFGFWCFCVKIIRENNIPIFYLLPFTFILFQPIFHRNIFWMLSCLQYQQSIFFTISAYYYLAKYTTKSFVISVILGVIHTQINANAVYIFMLGGLIPLYQGRYKMTLIYCSIGAVSSILFFRGMPTIVGLDGFPLQELLFTNPAILLRALGGFLGGGIFQFNTKDSIVGAFGIMLAIFIGIVLLTFIILIIKHLYKKSILNDPLSEAVLLKYDDIFRQRIIMILMAGSLLLTAVGVAISRGVYHKKVMIVDRYLLYSVVCIAVVYLLFIMFSEGKIRKTIGFIALPLSLIFCWHSYYKATPQVLYFERSHEADIYDLKHHRTTNNKMFGFLPKPLDLFEETLRRKIYEFPKSRFDTIEDILSKPIDNQTGKNLNLKFTHRDDIQNVYGGVKVKYFLNQDFYLPENDAGNTFFTVLKNEKNNDSFLIYPHRSPALRNDYLLKNQLFSNGFTTMIQQDCVKRGRYRIGLLIFENGKIDLKYTQESIDIDNTKMIDWMQTLGYFKNNGV